MNKKNCLFFLLLGLFSFPLNGQARVDLREHWDVSYRGQRILNGGVDDRWRDLESVQTGVQELVYETKVELSTEQIKDSIYLKTPPFWGVLDVTINGQRAVSFTNNGINIIPIRIHDNALFPISDLLKSGPNVIHLRGIGVKEFTGFRSNHFSLLSQTESRMIRLENMFINDIGYLVACIGLLFSVLCLVLGISLTENRLLFLHMGVFSVTLMPYNLLLTDLCPIFFSDPSTPFYFQLIAQMIAWPAMCGFLILLIEEKSKLRLMTEKGLLLIIPSVFALLVAWVLFGLKTNTFFNYILLPVEAVIVTLLSIALIKVFSSNINGIYKISWLGAMMFGSLDIFSELFRGNMYFLPYSALLLSGSTFYFVISDFIRTTKINSTLFELAQHFVPEPAIVRLKKDFSQAMDLHDLIAHLTGQALTGVLVVDICHFTSMASQFSREVIMNLRSITFEWIGEIAERNGLSFLKSDGDGLIFACGLLPGTKEEEIANSVGKTIVDLLSGIPALTTKLREKELPLARIKMSAAFGQLHFGPVGCQGRFGFDLEGFWMSVAQRQIATMNDLFYEKFGMETALISQGLFRAITDLEVKRYFHQQYEFTDKHGQSYLAYMAQAVNPSLPSKEQFMNDLYYRQAA